MFMRRVSFALLAIIGIVVALFASDARRPVAAQTATGSTVLISIPNDGKLPTGYAKTYARAWDAGSPRISADGKFIVFSTSMNLVLTDTNGLTDVYIYDRVNHQQILASPDTKGFAAGIDAYGADIRTSISADGRYVTYDSTASNLVADDTNNASDIFVFDRSTNTVSRVLNDQGVQPDKTSALPDISGNGTRIVFASQATNLITPTLPGNSIYYAYRATTGEWRVAGRLPLDSGGNSIATKPSISYDGAVVTYLSRTGTLNKTDIFYIRLDATGIVQLQSYRLTTGDQDSTMPEISDDGCMVTFKSAATNLVLGDTNGKWDIFVYNCALDSISRVSVRSDGSQANDNSGDAQSVYGGPTISGDGRYVTYASAASNLVDGDTNGQSDIFTYDRQTQQTSRISLNSTGAEGNGGSTGWPSMSNDHSLIVFASAAKNFSDIGLMASRNVFLRNLTATATPPVVTIFGTSPITATQNQLILLRGTVAHNPPSIDPGDVTKSYVWMSSIDGVLSQTQDYMLRISPLSLGTHSITLRVMDVDGDTGQSSALVLNVLPAPQNTLILTNSGRMSSLYPGDAALPQLATQLAQLAAHADVKGTIIDVQSDPAVQAAYSAWDSANTTANANQVSVAIKALIDITWKANPNLKYLLIVGDDRVIPFRREADGSLSESSNLLSESTYTYVASTSTIGRALADNQILTDDYYGYNAAAYSDAGRTPPAYYLPDLGIGRLIESPSEILGQIDSFLTSDTIAVGRATVSAYGTYTDPNKLVHDMLGDVGLQQCQTLSSDGILTDCSLVSTSWKASDFSSKVLSAGVRNDIVAFNHHAMHDAFGNDQDSVSGETLAQSGANLVRAILYTPGCHAGLNVPPNTPYWPMDLPQAAALQKANFVGNTGYGIVCTECVAWSESMFDLFTQQLVSGQTATPGQALQEAKKAYYSTLVDPAQFEMDKKVSLQTVLYGLPMYRYQTPGVMPAALLMATDAVQVTSTIKTLSGGLTINSLGYQFPPLAEVTTSVGHYFTLQGETQVANGKPVQPSYTANLSFPGTSAHGVVFRGGSYTDITPFDPMVAAAINEYAQPLKTTLSGTAWSPSLAARLNSLIDLDTLVAVLGQYQPASQTERIYQGLSLDIYYHTSSADWVAPVIRALAAVRYGDSATLSVQATDLSGVTAVVVAYTTSNGSWQSVELTSTDGQRWIGSMPASGSTHYFVQVIDGAGNVSANDNQGQYYSPITGAQYLPLIRR